MYLYKTQADTLLQGHHQGLLSELLNRHLFLTELSNDSDWSFVIKVQALVEGAITQAILRQIADERLKKTIETMPLIGEEASKISLAKALALLTSEQRRFVKRMATLRNSLAHRIENVGFTFITFTASLDKPTRRDWQESLAWFAESDESKAIWFRMATEQPRRTIYLGVFLLVALLDIDGSGKDILRKIDAAAEQTTKELLEDLFPTKSV